VRAGYLRNVAQFGTPAAIQSGRVIFNAAAEALFVRDPLARERWIEGLCAARVAGTAREEVIGRRTIVFFPVFDDENQIEASIGATGTLADLPRLLHLLRREMPHFGDILHQAPSVVLTARPNGRIDYLSRRWYEMVAGDSMQRPEDSLANAIGLKERRKFSIAWTQGIQQGEEFSVPVKIATRYGMRDFEVRARPVRRARGGILKWVAALVDIHDAMSANEKLMRLKNRFQTLAEATAVVLSAQTLDDVANGLVRLPSAGSDERWFVDLRDSANRVQIQRNISIPEREFLAALLRARKRTEIADVAGFLGRYVAAPILDDEAEPLGFIGYVRGHLIEVVEEDITMIEEIANRVALGADRILTFLREQELARMLQRSMLPLALPYSPGIRLDVAYEPAQRKALVGGDWYDAFELADGTIAVAIGDVAGHGFEAAIVMNEIRHAMHAAAMEDSNPAHVLAAANRLMNAQVRPMVTAFFGTLDPLTLTLTCASAGHPPALVVGGDGSVHALPCEGIPLGISDELFLENTSVELPAGGALVLYTDGVIEDERDILAGERSLSEALSRWALHGFIARAADLQSRVRVGSHQDDAAMFVLRFPHVDELELRLPATPQNAQRMRLAARRFVCGSPFEDDRAFDAVLAVGEAVNNAVEHAYDKSGGAVTLTLKRESERLIVEIRDEGMWREPKPYDRMHGLGIIQRLADKVEINHGENGTSVRVEISFARARAALLKEAAARA
jgi:anti-sigma regulatory factor (Ser/Thr protein kinase)/PAS domain-containing protein